MSEQIRILNMFVQIYNAANVGINVTRWSMQSWTDWRDRGINWTTKWRHSGLVEKQTGFKRTRTLRNFDAHQVVYHKNMAIWTRSRKARLYLVVQLYSVLLFWAYLLSGSGRDGLFFVTMKWFLGKIWRVFILISTHKQSSGRHSLDQSVCYICLVSKLSIRWIIFSHN
jgi:hypothetical protein